MSRKKRGNVFAHKLAVSLPLADQEAAERRAVLRRKIRKALGPVERYSPYVRRRLRTSSEPNLAIWAIELGVGGSHE